MAGHPKASKWTIEFEVRVSEENINEVKRIFADYQVNGDELDSLKPGQVIPLGISFLTESPGNSRQVIEMFNSEYSANWNLQYREEKGLGVLEFQYHFLVLEKTLSTIAAFFESETGKGGNNSSKKEMFKDMMGSWQPLSCSFETDAEERLKPINLFNEYCFGRPRLKVVEVERNGEWLQKLESEDDETPPFYSNTFFSLTSEEKKFLEANDQFFRQSIKHFESLCALGGNIIEKHLPENPEQLQPSDFDSHAARVAFFLAFLPVAFQHYRTILVLLKEGQKISAACVYRALLELYFDAAYINIRPRTIHRFMEYGSVREKWKLDVIKQWNLANIKPETEQQYTASYQKFCAKYSITEPNRELSNWAGISLKKMVYTILKENESDLKIFYLNYEEYSSYIHLNSAITDVLSKHVSDSGGAEQQFLDKIFYETIFNGWHIVWHMCTFALMTLPQQDKDDKDKISKFVDRYSENFNEKERIEKQAHEWQKIKIDLSGERASEVYNPPRREFLEMREKADDDRSAG
jgi:hypothetical protein